MRSTLLLCSAVAILTTACATVDGGHSSVPAGLASGSASFTFVEKAPFLVDRNYLDVKASYTGEWLNNQPHGGGQVTTNYGLSCVGMFGVEPYPGWAAHPTYTDLPYATTPEAKAEAKKYFMWGRGEVRYNGKLFYRGTFRNSFIEGQACLPDGKGTWLVENGSIAGEFRSEIASRTESGRIFVYDFMKSGECAIKRTAGDQYLGRCVNPADPQSGWRRIDNLDLSNPLVLGAPGGRYIDKNGRELSQADLSKKLACMDRHRQKVASARSRYQAARQACDKGCYGQTNGPVLGANLTYAQNELERLEFSDPCVNIDDASQQRLAAEEAQAKQEAQAEHNERLAELREREEFNARMSSDSAALAVPKPFDGLDQLNKIMLDGQAQRDRQKQLTPATTPRPPAPNVASAPSRSASPAAPTLTASARAEPAPAVASAPVTRVYSAEPNPYVDQYGRVQGAWVESSTLQGKYGSRSEACSAARSYVDKERNAPKYVVTEESPCVCEVNAGFQTWMAAYPEWASDRHSCRVYYTIKPKEDGATISK